MIGGAHIPESEIIAFAQRWHLAELSLFGSVLTDRFCPDSDIDVLVAFRPDERVTIEDWARMHAELEALFHRKVDLVERRLIVNPFRRNHILTHRRVLYAA